MPPLPDSPPGAPSPTSAVRALLRDFDFAGAGLPAPADWDPALRAALQLMLDSAIPVRMAIGPELHLFYNDAYIEFLEQRHPASLGRPYYEVWPEIRAATEPLMRRVLDGEPFFIDELQLYLERGGERVPAWFSYTFAPIRAGDGRVLGVYGACIEHTRRKQLEASLNDRNRQLRQMFQQAPGFIAIMRGPQHVFEFVNDALTALVGARDFLGRAAVEAIPELAPQGFQALLDGVYRTAQPYIGRGKPLEFASSAGPRRRYLNFVYQPIIEGDGSVSGIFLEGSDVTDEVEAEQHSAWLNQQLAEKLHSLESAEKRARFHLRLADEIRAAGDAYSIQARAAALLGRFVGARFALFADYRGADELVLHSCYAAPGRAELRGSFDPAALPWAAPAAFDAGAANERRVIVAGADVDGPATVVAVPHRPHAVLVRALLVVCAPDAPLAAEDLQLVADAAERIWTAVEKELAQAELREADRRKDEFLAMLAHELRNPLAPISAAAQLMSAASLSTEQLKKTSAVIGRQVKHMSELVDDLLDVSRVTRGMVKIARTPQNMALVVQAAVEQSRPLVQAREHALAVNLPDTPCHVSGDHKRLVQVLANLLNNAAKYTPPGGRIEVSLGCDGARVLVDVSDNGPGVPVAMRERIFALFAQAERTPDRAQGGLGLGLALVRSLVELHGGSVRCDAGMDGRGARFTVALPQLDTAARRVAPAAAEEAAAADALRVLVVDDNADAADMLAMFVAALGHAAHVELSSAGALALRERYDVGLFDLGLPGMDGYALARHLRAQPETAGMTLIAVTGYGDSADRLASRAAGFDHHLVKPVELPLLRRLLAEHPRRAAAAP